MSFEEPTLKNTVLVAGYLFHLIVVSIEVFINNSGQPPTTKFLKKIVLFGTLTAKDKWTMETFTQIDLTSPGSKWLCPIAEKWRLN